MNDLTSKLLKGMKKRGTGNTLTDSEFSKIPYYIPMESILLNLLISARWNGGVPAGRVTCFAGPKSHGKSQLAYDAAKKFQKDGGTVILIDSEFASEESALTNLGIDGDNFLYLPLAHMQDDDKEQSITYQLNEISKDIEYGDKVMFIFDSMGAWISKGTVANIEKNNNAQNMKIASEKKQLMSLITQIAGTKGIPIIVLNHSYENVGGFTGGQEVSGGGALYYPSTILLISSKSQVKIDEGGAVYGSAFRTSVYKGRLSRERAVEKWVMHYDYGILPYYGLEPYALEGGYIEETKDGRSTVFQIANTDIKCPKKTCMMPENNEFWNALFETTDFGNFLNDIFAYGSNKQMQALKEEVI
jgi:RecA/RadA recombinase